MKKYLIGFLICLAVTFCFLRVSAEVPDARRDATVIAVEQVMPSVVNIATRSVVPVRNQLEAMERQMFGLPSSYISLGSGVVIDEAGYLLTNDHVVRGAERVEIKFNTGTNVYEASVVASDPTRDVALLKLKSAPGEKFHAIKLAREDDLLLGETVLALGNPFGLGGSVTRGILSSKSRTVPKEGAPLDIPNWLQTDAPINSGNSGGPLINLRGELIGINVAVLNRTPEGEPVQGIGFAIPIRLVEEALADIFPTESVKSYWFGARVKVGTAPLQVASVQPESPAGQGGLKPGDTIVRVNGREPKSFIDFADLIAANPKTTVALKVQRGAEQVDVPVRLVPETNVFNTDLVRRKLGLSVEAKPLRIGGRSVRAFVITDVEKGSPAETVNLKKDMFLIAIDDQVPESPTELAKLIYQKKSGERVQLRLLTVQRDNDYSLSLQQWQAEPAVR
jgi:serine protease Do